jgi:hypothetical protein
MECDKALDSSRRELQLWFRPHSNQRSKPGVVIVQIFRTPTRDSFETPTWESWEKEPFGCSLRGVTQRTPGEGEEAATTSIIRIIQEVQGGEVMPPNGGIVRPENVQVKPFFPKGKLNTTLVDRVPGRTVGFNSLPSGHTDLNRRHPGLKKDILKGITVVEVHPAPFRPKVVEDETPEDIEWLASVRVASGVVREDAWDVVVKLHSGFTEEHKRLVHLKVAVSFPFAPYALESLPSLLGHGAVE